jgi:hypothetical protein
MEYLWHGPLPIRPERCQRQPKTDPLTARRFQYLSQHSCYMTGCGYGTTGRKRQLAVEDAY